MIKQGIFYKKTFFCNFFIRQWLLSYYHLILENIMKKSTGLILAACSVLSFNAIAAKHSYTRNLAIAVDQSDQFIADVGAGSLNIVGADVDEITVKARIYSKKYGSEDKLRDATDKKMQLSLEKKGGSIVLKAIAKQQWISFSSPNIAIDLDVMIPQHMSVEVDDGSGSMVIENIGGDLVIDDGSGSMVIKNIGGSLSIDDGSGSTEIRSVGMDIDIDDGSGEIKIGDVGGSVKIVDGSGSINIDQVDGNVSVDDGSGSIKVDDLAGDFNLIDDGSGSIHVNGKKWNINL